MESDDVTYIFRLCKEVVTTALNMELIDKNFQNLASAAWEEVTKKDIIKKVMDEIKSSLISREINLEEFGLAGSQWQYKLEVLKKLKDMLDTATEAIKKIIPNVIKL